jgi:uncharacterized protein
MNFCCDTYNNYKTISMAIAMNFRISGVTATIEEGEEGLRKKVASLFDIPHEAIASLKIIRRSIDARRNRPPVFVYTIDASVDREIHTDLRCSKEIKVESLFPEKRPSCPAVRRIPKHRPVIVGCGPAGLFAALTLAERGISSVLLERGKTIAERVKDVGAFWRQGILNQESNVHFGEGGAGTFSDGKLTSRARNPRTAFVKEILVEAGAPSDILTDAKPHIGTDRLRHVVTNLLKSLIEKDCDLRFQSRVTDFIVKGRKVEGVIINRYEEIRTDHIILACGQSADDTYVTLHDSGASLSPKAFAIGLRVEHPQELINQIQYGKWHDHPELPPAEYFLTAKLPFMNRSAYTFCMCPGGRVIGCSSAEGIMVTNGMSDYDRAGYFANSAVVVNVVPSDFTEEHSPLGGLAFRKRWEEKAYALGGRNYHAPGQRLVDFLQNREGTLPKSTTFLPGLKAVSLHDALPGFIVEALLQGVIQFERKMRGFITDEAVLIGVETRTSSPVRILRNPDGQSTNISGLYPCGEGAGYAGGIISSALDGIRIAESLAAQYEH